MIQFYRAHFLLINKINTHININFFNRNKNKKSYSFKIVTRIKICEKPFLIIFYLNASLFSWMISEISVISIPVKRFFENKRQSYRFLLSGLTRILRLSPIFKIMEIRQDSSFSVREINEFNFPFICSVSK